MINEFSKVAGYNINIQKLFAFLHTNNEILGKEYKNTIPFKLHPPKIKYLGINLTEEVYAENYKTLIKEMKEDSMKWNNIPYFWLGRINIIKMAHTTQSNLQIQCNPYPVTHDIFCRTRINNPKIYMEP